MTARTVLVTGGGRGIGGVGLQLGPQLPAFVSPEVYEVLHTQMGLHPITTPEQDLITV